jgi:alkylation response protein AidB-like acyl-CoA dehydrogenase
MKTFRTVDDLRAADVAFRDVALDGDARLGDGRDARAAIEEAVDFAAALGCAEAVGALDSANQATLEYLKTRRQFGVPIGSFQALQHRMVDMTIHAEQARSITLLACAKVDAAARGEIDAAERARIVSAAKVLVGTACRHVGQEAIQLHGGMGMTVEMKISHTFKRLTMLAQQFGDVDHHLERFAMADAAAASAAALQAKSAL